MELLQVDIVVQIYVLKIVKYVKIKYIAKFVNLVIIYIHKIKHVRQIHAQLIVLRANP
jgi:hypothetical protein